MKLCDATDEGQGGCLGNLVRRPQLLQSAEVLSPLLLVERKTLPFVAEEAVTCVMQPPEIKSQI